MDQVSLRVKIFLFKGVANQVSSDRGGLCLIIVVQAMVD